MRLAALLFGIGLLLATAVWFFYLVPLGCAMNTTGCKERDLGVERRRPDPLLDPARRRAVGSGVRFGKTLITRRTGWVGPFGPPSAP